MPTPTALNVAPTDNGCIIRIEGRGTMKESPAASAMANQTLAGDEHTVVVVDLSACTYLDSTFLGCLMNLYNHFGRGESPRFFVAGPFEHRAALLHAVRLDTVIPSMEQPPAARGNRVPIAIDPVDKRQLSQHVMECHRALAKAEGPMSGAFNKIADQLERELTDKF